MNGEKNSAILDTTFVPLGFVLRNAEADECTDDAADCATRAETRQCAHDGTSCD